MQNDVANVKCYVKYCILLMIVTKILKSSDKVALGGAAFSSTLIGLHQGTKTLTEYTARHALHEAPHFLK